MKKAKGILLFSGGLDSLIAAKILMEQNIELIGLHCILPFLSPKLDTDELFASKAAKEIGLNLIHYRCDSEYIDMLKNPIHGYGKNINPCIDCKIFFMKIAEKMMIEHNADFVATGEVVGQRPMSQLKHTLNHIENSTSLKGRLLRPLSAKLLKPTIPELEGQIDREKLLDINGRGRSQQIDLADDFGIEDYASPAGGCVFTDSNIAKRMFDIIEHKKNITNIDLYLCTIGRNYRINDDLKIIVARNEKECNDLKELQEYSDIIFAPEFSGPTVYASGIIDPEKYELIASIINRFGKMDENNIEIKIFNKKKQISVISSKEIVSDEKLNEMRI